MCTHITSSPCPSVSNMFRTEADWSVANTPNIVARAFPLQYNDAGTATSSYNAAIRHSISIRRLTLFELHCASNKHASSSRKTIPGIYKLDSSTGEERQYRCIFKHENDSVCIREGGGGDGRKKSSGWPGDAWIASLDFQSSTLQYGLICLRNDGALLKGPLDSPAALHSRKIAQFDISDRSCIDHSLFMI